MIPEVLILVLALGLIGAACSKSNNSSTTSGGSSPTESAASPSESSEGGGTITIDGAKANDHGTKTVSSDSIGVELDDFYFEPTTIQGTPGSKVKLELENEGSTIHNFTLTGQNIDQDVDAGEDADVTVTIPQSGSLQFFCKYHKSLGMVGQLSAS
jgi:plastocyanin